MLMIKKHPVVEHIQGNLILSHCFLNNLILKRLEGNQDLLSGVLLQKKNKIAMRRCGA